MMGGMDLGLQRVYLPPLEVVRGEWELEYRARILNQRMLESPEGIAQRAEVEFIRRLRENGLIGERIL